MLDNISEFGQYAKQPAQSSPADIKSETEEKKEEQHDAAVVDESAKDTKEEQDQGITLKVRIVKIIYNNPDNFYTVIKCRLISKGNYTGQVPRNISAVGTAMNISDGDLVTIKGEFKSDTKYGLTFYFHSDLRPVLPSSKDALMKFFEKHVKGVGKVTAEKIYDALGLDAIKIIEEHYQVLCDKLGMTDARAYHIYSQLADPSKYTDLVYFLQTVGISATYAEELFKKLGVNAVSKIKQNPYILTQIRGISFRRADRIGKVLHFSTHSKERFKGAIIAYLLQAQQEGSLAVPATRLYSDFVLSCNWMNINSAYVNSGYNVNGLNKRGFVMLYNILKQEQIIVDYNVPGKGRMIYLTPNFNVETHIVNNLYFRCRQHSDLIKMYGSAENLDLKIDELLDEFEKSEGSKLAERQREAVHMVAKNHVSNLTGGAGYGKTFVVAALIFVFQALYATSAPDTQDKIEKKQNQIAIEHSKMGIDPANVNVNVVTLVAPTGKAAHHMSEDTNYPASTIHRCLGLKPGSAKSEKFIASNLLVVDESSMIDAQLMNSLLYSVENSTHIVFIGDPHQLPPVGPGTVFKDMIDSGAVPTTKLNKVFRQNKSSIIFKNDQAILAGLGTEDVGGTRFTNNIHENNVFLEYDNQQDISNAVLKTVQGLRDGKFGKKYEWSDIMVISPQHKGITGVDRLNLNLQNKFTGGQKPENTFLSGKEKVYNLGDRMIQLKNDYEDAENVVMNGSVGFITEMLQDTNLYNGRIRKQSVGFEVYFPDDDATKDYIKPGDFDNIDLGFCTTVHKQQGSEASVVICVIDNSARRMLDRTLLYTAATRAKEKMIFIGQKDLFDDAIKELHVIRRVDGVKARLSAMASAIKTRQKVKLEKTIRYSKNKSNDQLSLLDDQTNEED